MPDCLPPGWIRENGPCALFEEIEENGINLGCGVSYTPADCPDSMAEGILTVGASSAKIASADGTKANLMVQRDASGIAFAKGFEVNGDNCSQASLATRIGVNDVSIGPVVGPNPLQVRLRLRGNGDVPAFGGTMTDADMGIFEINRTPGVNGGVFYENNGNPGASVGGHFFRNRSNTTFELQELMSLTTTAGTLYFPAWTYVSDERLKGEITPLDGQTALGVVLGISPIAYAMHGRRYHGFSAQDVQKVLPDAVSEPNTKDQPYTLRTDDIVANLVAAVKFLEARVQELEAKVG